MKIVFLDFDGVLIPLPSNGDWDSDAKPSREAIRNLNLIVQLMDASVVVSSSWRGHGYSIEDLTKILRSWGYVGPVVGKLDFPEYPYEDRGKLILQWLRATNISVEAFVALDDEPTTLEEIADHLVYVKPDLGIQIHDVRRAIEILIH